MRGFNQAPTGNRRRNKNELAKTNKDGTYLEILE
jgi:hypothetical protein